MLFDISEKCFSFPFTLQWKLLHWKRAQVEWIDRRNMESENRKREGNILIVSRFLFFQKFFLPQIHSII